MDDWSDVIVKDAICCNCGNVHEWDEDTCAIYMDKFVCEDCYQASFSYCEECGRLTKRSDIAYDYICNTCDGSGDNI